MRLRPGNHEAHNNFSHFTNRFVMPAKNQSSNLFYSFDSGLVHFVSTNTEVYFNMTGNGAASGDGNDCVKTQYNWLREDLAAANANRDSTPWVCLFSFKPCKRTQKHAFSIGAWLASTPYPMCLHTQIVVYGHRPMYCNVAAVNATANTTKCDGEQEQSRNGGQGGEGTTSGSAAGATDFAVEDLFHEFGVSRRLLHSFLCASDRDSSASWLQVDLAFYGHVHDYSRYLPAYNDSVVGGPYTDLGRYTDPNATVHFTVGGAGNPEMTDSPTGCAYYDGTGWAPWAAVTAGPYGSCTDVNFGRALAVNATHLHYQQVSVTSRGVVDDLWIVQHTHGSFAN